MNYKKKHYNNHDGIILLNKTQEEIVKEQFSNKILRINLWPPSIKSKKQTKIYLLNFYIFFSYQLLKYHDQ